MFYRIQFTEREFASLVPIAVLCFMLTYLSASKIFPVSANPIDKGILAVDEDGNVAAVYTAEEAAELNIRPGWVYEGILVPGFVNTHCHLELSHLKGQIPEHTGLLQFVGQVMKTRAADKSAIQNAMNAADREMYENGIVAVGDISNVAASKQTKLDSALYYQTFIEALGFNPEKAGDIFAQAVALQREFDPLPASVVPHAPYSVSDPLMQLISELAVLDGKPISMHNQETAAENEFFLNKTGGFLDLYAFLGLNLDFYQAPRVSSLQATLPKLPDSRVLLVHNTQTIRADVEFAQAQTKDVFWCLCPNANLYIENQLPDVEMLQEAGLRITLGTDSLASNHQLSILKEMQTLQLHKQVGLDTLLQWATLNGAAFLGIDDQYGSFEAGKKPGIILLEHVKENTITDQTTITRLY